MMNLHHLAVFSAVAEAGSVSGGAERLLISQPAVSKQLLQLERSLNARLVDRHAKGIRLTEAGRLLNNYAGRIFALSGDAKAALEDLSCLNRGSLSIGAGPTVGVYLLPKVLVQFRRQYPSIRLHVETEGPDLLGQRLRDGMLNFGLTESEIVGSEFKSKVFMTDVLVPVAPYRHRLAKKKSVTLKEFCAEPLIAREIGSGGKSLVERSLAGRGLAVEPILTVGSTEAIKQAVAAGLGVAIVSRLAIGLEVAARQLVELPVMGLAIGHPIYHVWRRGRSESKASETFLDLLRSYVGR